MQNLPGFGSKLSDFLSPKKQLIGDRKRDAKVLRPFRLHKRRGDFKALSARVSPSLLVGILLPLGILSVAQDDRNDWGYAFFGSGN